MSSNIRIAKVCNCCGCDFVARTTVTRYCSDQCAKKAYKQRERMKKIAQSDIENTAAIQNKKEMAQEKYAERTVLSIKQSCEYLGVSRMTLHRMMKSGEIPFTKMGGRVLILKNHLNKKLGL